MTDFKTTLLELAEPSDKTYASEDLKALESKLPALWQCRWAQA